VQQSGDKGQEYSGRGTNAWIQVSQTRTDPAGLTQREAEVLTLVAEGLRSAEIAERLYLTRKTVSHYRSAIYGRLGVETHIDAGRPAFDLEIVLA
jgi:DNA-binding NarL/FixJ family response regulator